MAVLALDAKYNVFRVPNNPQFRTLYIRRRSQILREKAKLDLPKDPGTLKEYLRLRYLLLSQRYGVPALSDQSSIRSYNASLRSNGKNTLESWEEGNPSSYPKYRKISPDPLFHLQQDFLHKFKMNNSLIVPTSMAEASRAMVGEITISENYSFSGVHHIFDQHKDAVTSVKFAHDDKSRLACSSRDGLISVCQLVPTPATVICTLQGHASAVTDFVWSLSNDTILSSSLDGTARLWKVCSAECLRIIINPNGSSVLSCIFQPINNNLFAIGDSKHTLQVMNLSTGKVVKGGTCAVTGSVLALCFDPSGKILWAGDSKGTLSSFLFDMISGRLIRAKKINVCEGHSITCISSRSWINREARDPSLLVNTGASSLFLYRIIDNNGGVKLKRKFPVKQTSQLIRSTFCPLISFRPGACIVTGSEDSSIYFFDVTKEGRSCMINSLQGHSAPVLDVSFAYDESLLASCDTLGVVIVWKRENKESSTNSLGPNTLNDDLSLNREYYKNNNNNNKIDSSLVINQDFNKTMNRDLLEDKCNFVLKVSSNNDSIPENLSKTEFLKNKKEKTIPNIMNEDNLELKKKLINPVSDKDIPKKIIENKIKERLNNNNTNLSCTNDTLGFTIIISKNTSDKAKHSTMPTFFIPSLDDLIHMECKDSIVKNNKF